MLNNEHYVVQYFIVFNSSAYLLFLSIKLDQMHPESESHAFCFCSHPSALNSDVRIMSCSITITSTNEALTMGQMLHYEFNLHSHPTEEVLIGIPVYKIGLSLAEREWFCSGHIRNPRRIRNSVQLYLSPKLWSLPTMQSCLPKALIKEQLDNLSGLIITCLWRGTSCVCGSGLFGTLGSVNLQVASFSVGPSL